jgi:hypothetical protein
VRSVEIWISLMTFWMEGGVGLDPQGRR